MAEPVKRNGVRLVLLIVAIVILLVFIGYTLRNIYQTGRSRADLRHKAEAAVSVLV